MKTIVNYYDSSATRIVRSREYPTIRHARRAMARAAKRHVIAALAGTRLASDPPTVHH
jgi:outer membrane lipoprotein SlyB